MLTANYWLGDLDQQNEENNLYLYLVVAKIK